MQPFPNSDTAATRMTAQFVELGESLTVFRSVGADPRFDDVVERGDGDSQLARRRERGTRSKRVVRD